MTMTTSVRALLLAGVGALAVSCAPLNPAAAGPHFHEGASADLVLVYYSDESIFISKPDTRENGFLPLFTRKDVTRRLEQYDTSHNLAVVVIGRMTATEQAALIQDWQAKLFTHGFRRVVCLQASGDDRIDGLLILRDSAMPMPDDETGKRRPANPPAP